MALGWEKLPYVLPSLLLGKGMDPKRLSWDVHEENKMA